MSLEATEIVQRFAAGLAAPPSPPPADSAPAPASATGVEETTESPGAPPPSPPAGAEGESGTPAAATEPTEEGIIAAATEEGEPEPSAAKRVWQAYKGLKDLEKEEKEGGIGHIPTPEQIKTYYDQSITLNMMLNSLMTKGIGGLNTFFGMIENFAPGTEGQVYADIPNLLKNLQDQSHYNTMKNFFVDEVLGELWGKASASAEGEEKTGWTNLVTALYFFRHGKKFDPAQGIKAPENPEVSQLREENRRLQEATVNQQGQTLSQQYMNEVQSLLWKKAGEALTPLKAMRSEGEFQVLVKTAASAAVAEITQSPAFMAVLNANFARVKPLLLQGKIVDAQNLFNSNRDYVISRIGPYIQKAVKAYLPTKPVAVAAPKAAPAGAGPASTTSSASSTSAPAGGPAGGVKPIPIAAPAGGIGNGRPPSGGDRVMDFLRSKGHAI